MTADRATTKAPDPVLDVRDLSVRFRMRGGRDIAAVTDARFSVAPGECLALVGESGCGKSVLASALLGLLPANAATTGSAVLGGDTDLLTAGERTLARTVRGRRIGLVPQSPAAHLTPVRTVRAQLEESLRELTGVRRSELPKSALAAAARASFPEGHLDRYPHELSGGLAQRAATALALIGDAPLLLADEPTTGLDRDLVERTVDELRRHTDEGRALLIITHDLAAAERIADRVAVMYAGRIVEIAEAEAFFGAPGPATPTPRVCWTPCPSGSSPRSPGCRRSWARCPTAAPSPTAARTRTPAAPANARPSRRVWPATTGSPAGHPPRRRSPPMLELTRITAGYDRRDPVVRDVSLHVGAGEAVGLLGPSGCGKSTLAKVAALLHRPDAGTMTLDGTVIRGWRHRAPREQRTAVGVVFQQPRLSADPRLSLRELIAQPLRSTGRRRDVPERVAELAPLVGLSDELLERRPHAVSDGQLQRACLARALVLRPRLLICDEMTAMLDASTTAALVAVVERYRAESGAALLAVGHDRVLLERWCDRTVRWDERDTEKTPAAIAGVND
ncbi:ABC-type glutathione transport system ATPase component, contains duplicated ATPase domain [Streptomyces sp. Termitarium-T10T-6]|nr:ABC-type glutathione transport system ATPase component, contains duplicated ATPase domain [Streptomyces sp. Termitarium-T10T-6]